jgi:hypothetical protein
MDLDILLVPFIYRRQLYKKKNISISALSTEYLNSRHECYYNHIYSMHVPLNFLLICSTNFERLNIKNDTIATVTSQPFIL